MLRKRCDVPAGTITTNVVLRTADGAATGGSLYRPATPSDTVVCVMHPREFMACHYLIPDIVVLPYRNPFLVAKSAATIDALSDGRFILAIATGYLRGEYRALGVDFEQRNALFDEAVEVIRGIWTEDGGSWGEDGGISTEDGGSWGWDGGAWDGGSWGWD